MSPFWSVLGLGGPSRSEISQQVQESRWSEELSLEVPENSWLGRDMGL